MSYNIFLLTLWLIINLFFSTKRYKQPTNYKYRTKVERVLEEEEKCDTKALFCNYARFADVV